METWGDDEHQESNLSRKTEVESSEPILPDLIPNLLEKIVRDQLAMDPCQSEIKNLILMDSLKPMSVIKTKDKGGFLKCLLDINKLSKIGILDDNLTL